MNRKKKLALNTITGLLKQCVTMVCGFVLPRYMLVYYGSSVNGLVSSISHFLGFISLLDLGVGAVVQSNLYKPLANQDKDQISKIVMSSERFFRRLGFIFLGYIIVLCSVYPKVVDSDYNYYFTASLVIIISVSTLVQYLYGMTYQLLLNADQRSYIPLTIQMGTTIINTVLAIVLMKAGASFHLVKLMSATVFVLRPFLQIIYVRKHYTINRMVRFEGEPIKQKWNGFSQHLAAVVCQNIDVTVLTLFSTLSNVSVYSVYFNVTNGIEQIVMTAATGIEALFGDLISKGEKEKLTIVFTIIEWIAHTIVTLIFTIAGITIVPFVSVYTKGIDDANYLVPLFGWMLVLAYASHCLRIPYFRVIKAAGHYKETQNGAYISALLNVIVSVMLVFKYGLIGTAIGTLVAMAYHTIYFAWYLKDNILHRGINTFARYILTDAITACLTCFFSRKMITYVSSYYEWFILAIKVSLVSVIISIVVNMMFYRSQITISLQVLQKKDY